MPDASRPRRVSRAPAGRPRRLAGRAPEPDPAVEPVETPGPEAGPEPEHRERGGFALGARRTTLALVAAVVMLALVGAGEIVYLVRDDTPPVSASRPVVTGELTQRAAVEWAARSTEQILSTTYQEFDTQVEQATAKMTDAFAEQYRQTSAGIRDQFIARRMRLQVKAVAQGVVQASPEQVQALLFLDQYVEKVVDRRQRSDYAQYRALVTVLHTDHGWLVSRIETQ